MDVIKAIEGEFRRYKSLAENAVAQLGDSDLSQTSGNGNSVATLFQHVGGNLKSRFSDFLTSDGEKPWRDREAEFADHALTRAELMERWEEGWTTLLDALAGLRDEQLRATVTIRGASLSVVEALARSLAHTSYHVGQIVLLAREARGSEWQYLSIPPAQSAAYTADLKKNSR